MNNKYSDCVMASAWMLTALQSQGRLKRPDKHSGAINVIRCPELLEELLNYKPTKMKQFKNRFAVTGDIIQLLTFEKELIKLGYTLGSGSLGKSDVFNYRGISKNPATHITVGLHNVNSVRATPGSYIPAANDGNAKLYNVLYDLSSQFKEALKVASEEITHPLLITEDGVKKYIDDKAWCVRKDFFIYFIKNGLDENSPWPGCKYFDTEKAALEYVDKIASGLLSSNNKLYSKRQIMEILKKSITRKTFYIHTNRNPVQIDYFDLDKINQELNINP